MKNITLLLAIFFLVTGLSILIRRKMLLTVLRNLFSKREYTYLLGLLMLVAGLCVALLPESSDPAFANVPFVGWYLVMQSIFYIFLSQKSLRGAYRLIEDKKIYILIGAGELVISWALFFLYYS